MDVKPGYKQTEVGVIPNDWGVAVLDSLGKHGRPAIKAGPFGSSLTKEGLREVVWVNSGTFGCDDMVRSPAACR